MNLLHTIGLMTRAEHERIVADNDEKAYEAWVKIAAERDDFRAKFKKAGADLEKQAGEIEDLTADVAAERIRSQRYAQDAADLRPDALAMRRKRQRDRELKAAKTAGKVQP